MLHIAQIYGEADFVGRLTDARLFYRLEMEAGLKTGEIFHIQIQRLQQESWQEVLPGPYLSDLGCDLPAAIALFTGASQLISFISEGSISQSPHCRRNKAPLRRKYSAENGITHPRLGLYHSKEIAAPCYVCEG